MQEIKVGNSKMFIESLNESSAKKCGSFRNKNVIFRGSSSSAEYGSVMCAVAMLHDIDEKFWLEFLGKFRSNFSGGGGYFAMWSYWNRPDQTYFVGSISKDPQELEIYANSILQFSGLHSFISTRPKEPEVQSGISIKNGIIHVADSVKVRTLVL